MTKMHLLCRHSIVVVVWLDVLYRCKNLRHTEVVFTIPIALNFFYVSL